MAVSWEFFFSREAFAAIISRRDAAGAKFEIERDINGRTDRSALPNLAVRMPIPTPHNI